MIVSELVALLGFKTDTSGAQQFDRQLDHLRQRSDAVAAGISASLSNMMLNAASTIAQALGAALGNIPKAGDEMNSALAKIESAIGRTATSGAEAADIYEKLYEVGQKTGVSADDSAQAFTRFNLAMQKLKRPAQDTIDLLSGIQAAGVVSGNSTTELRETMRQLSQAFGSDKLQGEELGNLRENMPRFLQDVMKEMNMTSAEFFAEAEKGDKGKLNSASLTPAFLKAGETARKELAKFPIGMASSYKVLSDSTKRFMADLDKQLDLSQSLARSFVWVNKLVNDMRGGLSVVGDWVRFLGGLEGIARLVGIALLVAFGPSLLGSIGMLTTAFMALGRMILVSLLPLAGFLAWVLIVEDFISWMQGKDSKFGDKFGDFETVIAPLKDAMETAKVAVTDAITSIQADWTKLSADIKPVIDVIVAILVFLKDAFISVGTGVIELIDKLIAQWERGVGGMKPQIDWVVGAARMIMDAFRPLVDFFNGVIDAIIARFVAFYDKVAAVVNGIRRLIPGIAESMEGTGGTGEGTPNDPLDQDARRMRFGSRGGLGGFGAFADPDTVRGLGMTLPDASGRMGGTINAPQSNAITNNVTVNAPGADPASVAMGTQNGMQRATDYMAARLGNSGSLALGLGVANPRVEAAAQ